MKLSTLAAAAVLAAAPSARAFLPAVAPRARSTALGSTLEESRGTSSTPPKTTEFKEPSELTGGLPFLMFEEEPELPQRRQREPMSLPLSGEEINARLAAQLEKLRSKDRQSIRLSKEDLAIVYEDKHIVVVNKPTGVLTVAGKEPNPSLAEAVFDHIENSLATPDHMVVHRLGMDTSGVIVLAKDMDAVRGMNGVFRERKIERHYEALVVGHMKKPEGVISLPLMRDYECPPYVRVSTDDHQVALIDLEVEEVGKKILEGPKKSITQYRVLSHEEFEGEPVTRIALTSYTGRYHQLNVHLAAFGHPIVGDTVYGFNGEALPNGGLTDAELKSLISNPNRAEDDLQQRIAAIIADRDMAPCVHAKSLKFRHPVTKKIVELTSEAPF